MKKFLRATAKTLGALGIAILFYGLLMAHPEPLFAHSVTSSNITFYSRSPLSPQIALVAAAVDRRLATSELYEPSMTQRVFVVERPWLWNLLNGPYRRAMARNIELGNAILVPQLDASNQAIIHFDGRRAGAIGILTHEAVHTLVQRRIGLFRLWRLAWWQKEGYPEYIASERGTHSEAPVPYQEAARRWKSLLETRHLTFDQIIRLTALPKT